MLSVVLLLVTIAGLSSCATTPKVITSGQYVFTVTGVDSKDASNTASAQIKVRVL